MAQVPRVGRGQKRVYDPLELELEMVVYDHVGIRTQAWVLWKDSKWSELRIHLYSLIFFLVNFIHYEFCDTRDESRGPSMPEKLYL